MVRKQIVIDAERDARVAQMARERGVSQSEIIRLAIDALAENAADQAARDAAFARLMDSFEHAVDLGLTDESGQRTWTREGLHGDRGLR